MIALVKQLRPTQWLKNLMLLFPPFLAGSLLDNMSWSGLMLPIISFCMAASCLYILNDIVDCDRDALHPKKKLRPLPSQTIGLLTAKFFAFFLGSGAILLGQLVSPAFVFILIAYMIISVAYSLKLKHVPILELFCVVSGFLLRLMAGGVAFETPISNWLFLSVLFLALFLIGGKRINEARHEGGESPEMIRPVLACYPPLFLEGVLFISGAAALMTYSMYVLVHSAMVYTVPLCCYGLLRFLFNVLLGKGGDPTRAILKDPTLFAISFLWVCLTAYAIYGSNL